MKIFLSHSSTDEKVAQEVCALVEQHGHSCFYAPRDIRSGCEYAEEIINGIDDSAAMLLLLSEAANGSPHVLREVERAVSRRIPIIVYKLEEVALSKSMEYFLMTHQWLNARSDKGYEEIVHCIDEFEAGKKLPVGADVAPLGAQKKPQDNKKLILILLVSAAVLIAVGVVVAMAFNSDNDDIGADVAQTVEAGAEITDSQGSTDVTTTPAATTVVTTSAATSATTVTTTTTPEVTSDEPTVTTADTVDITTADTASQQTEAPIEEIQPEINAELGDMIILGEYNDEPVEWRIIRLSEDGTKATVIANDILTLKAFDAAESGHFNNANGESYWNIPISEIEADVQPLIRGDNSWEKSNIRTWLNSARENVQYSGQAPVSSAMSESTNGYNTEAGFLKSFTDEELSAIVTSKIDTNGTITEDMVYLLSYEELDWLMEADVSIDAGLTTAAAELDASGWYEYYSVGYNCTDHFWWLRDHAVPADHENNCEVYVVANGYKNNEVFSDSASLEGYGVRPVMTIDLTSEYITIE